MHQISFEDITIDLFQFVGKMKQEIDALKICIVDSKTTGSKILINLIEIKSTPTAHF